MDGDVDHIEYDVADVGHIDDVARVTHEIKHFAWNEMKPSRRKKAKLAKKRKDH